MKSRFNEWYSEQITAALKAGKDIQDVVVDMSTPVIRNNHAAWMVSAHAQLNGTPSIVTTGFRMAGITAAVTAVRNGTLDTGIFLCNSIPLINRYYKIS